ncbi:MAG: rod shape-determining protein MreC [Myxococcaceae bacterium]|nr:rod shape-determining protein MreC [Myxococcaceae bacterium]MBH2006509.1 rod shape-determining protein MreC [Myxococcaceae bacterium]
MWRFLGKFKTLVAVACLLAAPFVVSRFRRKAPALSEVTSGIILDLSSSIQQSMLWLFGGVTDLVYRVRLNRENEQEVFELRKMKPEVRALEILLTESEQENQRLRVLLGFSAERGLKERVVGASIIGELGAPLVRNIQIDRGSAAGVKKGDAVMVPSGAVGQVMLVGKHSSQVLLLTDTSSAIDVVLERSRAKGIMRGTLVRDFDRLQDVREGDVVVTSGVGAKFPEGMPVGRVSKVENHRQGLYVEAQIEPFVRFNHLEEVLILTKTNQDAPAQRREAISQSLRMSPKL